MSIESIETDVTLDVKGLGCPMPVLKTKLAFKKMEPGQVLEVISTDPGSRKDLPAWADKTGNELISALDEVDDVVGAAAYVAQALDANISLFI